MENLKKKTLIFIPLIIFLSYMYVFMNYFFLRVGFGFSDFKYSMLAVNDAASGKSPYNKGYLGTSFLLNGFYCSPFGLNYYKLFNLLEQKTNENLTQKIFAFCNALFFLIGCFIWLIIFKEFYDNIIIPIFILFLITHFHPGIVWNAALANINELIFLLLALFVLFYLNRRFILCGITLSLILLFKFHFAFIAIFAGPYIIRTAKNKIALVVISFCATILLTILITPYPFSFWQDWIDMIFSRYTIDNTSDVNFIDYSIRKFKIFGDWLSYLLVIISFIFMFKVKINRITEIFCLTIAITVLNLFLKNFWVTYIIFFLPFQFAVILYYYQYFNKNIETDKQTDNSFAKSLNCYNLIILAVSLCLLNGPFFENRTVLLKNIPAGNFKNILLTIVNNYRTIGLISVLLLVFGMIIHLLQKSEVKK